MDIGERAMPFFERLGPTMTWIGFAARRAKVIKSCA